MLKLILPILRGAKSLSDIFTGKADAEDIDVVVDVAGQVITTFVPQMAAIMPFIEAFKEPMIEKLNLQEPGLGDKFARDYEQVQKTIEHLSPQIEEIAAKLDSLDEPDLNEFLQERGY